MWALGVIPVAFPRLSFLRFPHNGEILLVSARDFIDMFAMASAHFNLC